MSEPFEIDGVKFETEQAFDAALLDNFLEGDDGLNKQASAASAVSTRRRIRENAAVRRIMEFKTATNDMLHPSMTSERPMLVRTMEPLSPAAKPLSFYGSADTAFYREDKYPVYFYTISTPEFTKNTDELRTAQPGFRNLIVDNSLKSLQDVEDADFLSAVDVICGDVDPGVGAGGNVQHHVYTGEISRATYTASLQHLWNETLNNGTFLTTRNTGLKFLELGRDAIGGDLSERFFTEGLEALKDSKIMGVPHLFSIKRELIADNVVYQFTEPGYFGEAYTLEEVKMYVKKEKDILRFSGREKIGISIPNVAGCQKIKFGGDYAT
jgi:hypothetical protein